MKILINAALSCALLLAAAAPLSAEASATASAAATAGVTARMAAALLDSGLPQQAYDLLLPRQSDGDPDISFLLAQAAARLGRHEEAAGIYEGMLRKNGKLPRVRLELARSYAALGRTDKARQQFLSVLSDAPPPVVGENISRYMSSMEKKKDWNSRAALGYIYDSNVNAGPAAASVLMFGVPFSLSPDARRTGGSGYTFSAGAGGMKQLKTDLALQADAQYGRTGYRNLKPYDSDVFSASAGLTLRRKNYILSAPLLYEYVMIGHKKYNYACGAAPQLLVPLDERWSASASGVVQRKKYYVGGGLRDGSVWSASAGAKYHYSSGGFLQASYRRAAERTRADYLDNDSDGLTLGWYAALPKGFSLYLAPGFSYTRYAGTEAAYDRPRRDRQYSAVLNLSRDLKPAGLSAALGYTFTRNDSNLALYDYRRGQFTAQASYSF